jgi:hypothetical protein
MQVEANKPDDAWLDFDFTVLAKRAREEIMATITLPPGVCARLSQIDCTNVNTYSKMITAKVVVLAETRAETLSQKN